MDWLNEIKWDTDGLVPAIAQDAQTGKVLMMAWMNRESLQLTVAHARSYGARAKNPAMYKN